LPDDIKCTSQCQLHKDIKDLLDKHDKAIFGDVDKDGILTKMSSFMTVRTIVYTCIALISTGFLGGLIALVWKGAK
jgi:hypothetical protein